MLDIAQEGSATRSRAALAGADDIAREVAALSNLDVHELRVRWRKVFRRKAPPHLPRYLLHRIIAYRIQASAFGDLDRAAVRLLEKIAKERAAGAKPTILPPEVYRRLKPGTLLVREHAGIQHRVTVTDGGFDWNGSSYRSLSEVARAVTGTNWNGPLFFGLRERRKAKEGAL